MKLKWIEKLIPSSSLVVSGWNLTVILFSTITLVLFFLLILETNLIIPCKPDIETINPKGFVNKTIYSKLFTYLKYFKFASF